MGESGRLSLAYLNNTLPKLKSGRVYELMCHPGYCDTEEINDARILDYHDWEGERNILTSIAVKELSDSLGIRLIGYRHVRFRGDGSMVVLEEITS